MDWNERGVKTVGGGKWQGSMIRRVLMSPRIAGLKEHRGEIVGIIVEPIQGAGGHRVAEKEFFQGLSRLAHDYEFLRRAEDQPDRARDRPAAPPTDASAVGGKPGP